MNIDCGDCPNVTSGCLGVCMKATPAADHCEEALHMVGPVVQRHDPAEWRYRFTHRGELSKWFPVDSYLKLQSIGNDPTYEVQPLYTSQPAPVSVVRYSWDDIVDLVSEVIGCEYSRDPNTFIGHQMTGINFNSLARIIDKVKELNQ